MLKFQILFTNHGFKWPYFFCCLSEHSPRQPKTRPKTVYMQLLPKGSPIQPKAAQDCPSSRLRPRRPKLTQLPL